MVVGVDGEEVLLQNVGNTQSLFGALFQIFYAYDFRKSHLHLAKEKCFCQVDFLHIQTVRVQTCFYLDLLGESVLTSLYLFL